MKATPKRTANATQSVRNTGGDAKRRPIASNAKMAQVLDHTIPSDKPKLTRSKKKMKWKGATLEDLRSRRDMASMDGDFALAFTIAIEIDKLKGY